MRRLSAIGCHGEEIATFGFELATDHHDSAEGSVVPVWVSGQMGGNRQRPCTLTPESDLIGISTEAVNELLDPSQGHSFCV